ncbi:uncharacterized protein LOC112456031, partial [Temnothorax curvispinosus]|uniref:Uncharacterized protein LOC112456031 n=1 Tax=Temnothorax curvispinosus TaxID=300111 RepID=A0A6J1PXJ0_9HYME
MQSDGEGKAAKIQSKKMEATGEATGTVDLIKSQKKLGQIQDKDEKKVDTLTSQNNEEYLFIGAIENNSEKHVWLTELEINEKRMKFKLRKYFEGCEQYIDDVIVWGKNKAEHDERLRKVLETAKRNKVKFNLSKCQFGKSNVKYMGHIISAEGVALDESKVTAIKELQTPKCKEDVQRVLGMLTY